MTGTELARRLVAGLAARGVTLGTCESMTAGGIAAMITTAPGASVVLRGGLVTYSSDLKISLAGVDAGWVADHGVINEVTARQMAEGARIRLDCDWVISVTGLAGPGAEPGIAVGTTWFGLAGRLETLSLGRVFAGDRQQIRAQAIETALQFVCEELRLEPE